MSGKGPSTWGAFLIGASPQRDYRNLVIPDFIKEVGAEREIISAAKDDFCMGKGEPIRLRGCREGFGPIDMIFRATHVGRGQRSILATGCNYSMVLVVRFASVKALCCIYVFQTAFF